METKNNCRDIKVLLTGPMKSISLQFIIQVLNTLTYLAYNNKQPNRDTEN